MENQYTPNQYRLIGENLPMWLVMGMLLFGVLGSVITAKLLLTSETQIEMLMHWVQSNSKESVSDPPSPVSGTTEIPMAGALQNQTAEQIDQIPQMLRSELQSLHVESKEIQGVSTGFSTKNGGRPTATASPVASTEQKVSITHESLTVKAREDTQQLSSLSTDGKTDSTPSTRTAPARNQLRDCPPLFTVTFDRGSTRPIELDLSKKATKLQEWLNIHPETILHIEGHTDSTGPEELNLLISHRRAKVVYELLARAGIAKNQMQKRAFGEYTPLAGLPTKSGNNRRVFLRTGKAHECQESQQDRELR